jgi:Tol biopolymer transport system component
VTFWTRVKDPVPGSTAVNVWAVPTIGGEPRLYRNAAVEIDWSADGSRSVFHTTEPGDPTFVAEGERSSPRRINAAARGVHCHFQLWSPEGAFIYFTQGTPPDEMDLWRMKPDGTGAERLTFHNSRVVYPAFLDRRTLLYLATSEDGAGPWLYALDVERRTSRRISFGVEQYTSLAASADGRRLVATIENARTSLWRVPITDGIVGESAASRIEVRTVGGSAPRAGPDYLLHVSPQGTGYGIWKLAGGTATELWSAAHARPLGGAAISPDGKQVAFAEENRNGRRLHVMGADGSGARVLAESLELRAAPAWSPDGRSLTVAAVMNGRDRRLFRVPLDGTAPVQMFDADARNPLWSPDGSFFVYGDADVGPTFAVKAVKADGTPHPLPPITLPRGSRRLAFVPGRRALVVLQGEMRHVNFWYVDLDSGQQRQLTDFGREFAIRDFDVTAGGEIVFDRLRDNSDIALIELQGQ